MEGKLIGYITEDKGGEDEDYGWIWKREDGSIEVEMRTKRIFKRIEDIKEEQGLGGILYDLKITMIEEVKG